MNTLTVEMMNKAGHEAKCEWFRKDDCDSVRDAMDEEAE